MRVRLPPPAPASLLSKRSISLTSFCPLTATRAGGGEENPQEGCGETSPPTDTCRAATAGRPREASARRRLPPPAPASLLSKRSISLTSFCPLTATRAGGGEENPQEGCGETSPPT